MKRKFRRTNIRSHRIREGSIDRTISEKRVTFCKDLINVNFRSGLLQSNLEGLSVLAPCTALTAAYFRAGNNSILNGPTAVVSTLHSIVSLIMSVNGYQDLRA